MNPKQVLATTPDVRAMQEAIDLIQRNADDVCTCGELRASHRLFPPHPCGGFKSDGSSCPCPGFDLEHEAPARPSQLVERPEPSKP